MNYKYTLPNHLVEKVSSLSEFANGGSQVTIILKDGSIHNQVLISNSTHLVAMRGHHDLPFCMSDIQDIIQSPEDINPPQKSDWNYWDKW